MVNLRKAVAVVAAPIALALTVGAGTASAAGTGGPTAIAHPGVKGASPNAVCSISEYGYTGLTYCGFGATEFDWSGGTEYFVVGTDYQVWHIWQGSGGWQPLGGKTTGSTPNNGVHPISNVLGVWMYGTDNRQWCDDWGTPWSGWHLC